MEVTDRQTANSGDTFGSIMPFGRQDNLRAAFGAQGNHVHDAFGIGHAAVVGNPNRSDEPLGLPHQARRSGRNAGRRTVRASRRVEASSMKITVIVSTCNAEAARQLGLPG